jgi:hypothetical protein
VTAGGTRLTFAFWGELCGTCTCSFSCISIFIRVARELSFVCAYIYNNTFITTPNLTDKFIKAVNNSSEIGESSTTLVKQPSSEEIDVYSLIFIMKL